MYATRYIRILSIWILLALLSACNPAVNQAEPAATSILQANSIAKYEPVYEKMATCPFTPHVFPEVSVECGYLVVPEDRTRLDSPSIKIAVAVYHTASQDPQPDPLLILSTFPSGQIQNADQYPYVFPDLLGERDFIVVDVRGTGYSLPAFDCPQASALYFQTLEQDPDSTPVSDQNIQASVACRKQWNTLSSNLGAYSTEQIAADLEDLRQVLGIRQWNLFAQGYGTRLAYTLLRDAPSSLRSVFLDILEPMDGDIFSGGASRNQEVLELFFKSCSADKKCSQAFPDLEQVFYETVDQLNSHPVTIDTSDLQNGGKYKLYVDGNRLVNLVTLAFTYNVTAFLPEMPRMIYQVKAGQYERMSYFMGFIIGVQTPNSVGMNGRIHCVEGIQYVPPEKVKSADNSANPLLKNDYIKQEEQYRDYCQQVWGDLYDSSSSPVSLSSRSDVPVLVIQGAQNVATLPAWVKEAQKLGNTHYIEFANTGIADWTFSGPQSACAKPIFKQFVDTPDEKPEASCASVTSPVSWITLR